MFVKTIKIKKKKKKQFFPELEHVLVRLMFETTRFGKDRFFV